MKYFLTGTQLYRMRARRILIYIISYTCIIKLH